MWKLDALTARLPNWTWQELPELDEGGGSVGR